MKMYYIPAKKENTSKDSLKTQLLVNQVLTVTGGIVATVDELFNRIPMSVIIPAYGALFTFNAYIIYRCNKYNKQQKALMRSINNCLEETNS